jgi:hypothetical protein
MLHLYLEVAAAAVAVVPLSAVYLAWRRTRDARMGLAVAAFAIFEARLVSMVLIHTLLAVDHLVEELVEFVGDLLVIIAFASAFLYGTRWRFVPGPRSDA